jgi:CBS domain containing-hemolysin-like protein
LSFICAAEAGLASLDTTRVKNLFARGVPNAQTLERLLEQPANLLSAIIISRSIALVAYSCAITLLAVRLFAPSWPQIVGIITAGLLIAVFLQLAFRSLAVRTPERTAIIVANAVRVIVTILTPLTKLFAFAVRLALLPFRRGKASPAPSEEAEELAILGEIEEEEGRIEDSEKEMIRGILGLEETSAREIMVPRPDIVAVDTDTPLPEVIDLVLERGYSRIPLYQDTIDNVVGVIYAKDLLRYTRDQESQVSLLDIARPPYFIPESKKIGELLRELQEKKVHIAIVIDEYGGVSGLVTIEDLLEEIVGEIEDEYDIEEPKVEWLGETEAIVDAKLSVDDLNEIFGLSIQTEGFDSVGGFVYAQLGRIPTVNDTLEIEGLTITVLATLGRRIRKVKVAKTGEAEQFPA